MIGRRGLIASVGAALLGGLGFRRYAKASGLFPPSASSDFGARCIRCLRCAEVCPVEAIRVGPALGGSSPSLPVLEPQTQACTLCMKCTEVCPTGALSPIPRELEAIRENVRMGMALLDRQRCLTHTRQASCRLCFEVCPFSGEAITLSGLGQGPVIMPDACVGCGRCAEACPSQAKAIQIIPLKGAKR